MSVRAGSDLLTLPIDHREVNEGEYLSDVSKRHKPWDTHRAEADEVQEAYAGGTSRHQRYATRVEYCSQVIGFARTLSGQGTRDPPGAGVRKLKLTNAWFCRVRHCPVCQWRRSLMWQAKVYRALPALLKDFPHARFLFMTLTVRNCEVKDLRKTLLDMAKAWKRMIESRQWPARGWVRAVEITRSEKYRTAHPHYHCLLVVPPAYFQGDYLKQVEWAELWRKCLRVDYRPVVDIRTVKLDLIQTSRRVNPPPKQLWGAVAEILKYAVKPSDMIRDHEWFRELVDQVHKIRGVAVGGILKRYIKERDTPGKGAGKENLLREPGDEELMAVSEQLHFGWKQDVRRYRKIVTISQDKGSSVST